MKWPEFIKKEDLELIRKEWELAGYVWVRVDQKILENSYSDIRVAESGVPVSTLNRGTRAAEAVYTERTDGDWVRTTAIDQWGEAQKLADDYKVEE